MDSRHPSRVKRNERFASKEELAAQGPNIFHSMRVKGYERGTSVQKLTAEFSN